jgi:hypothetical protein
MNEELLTGLRDSSSASCLRRFWVAKTMISMVSVATPATVMIISVVSDPSNSSCILFESEVVCELSELIIFCCDKDSSLIVTDGDVDGRDVRRLGLSSEAVGDIDGA